MSKNLSKQYLKLRLPKVIISHDNSSQRCIELAVTSCYTHNCDLLQIMDREYLRIEFHWGKSSTGTKHGAFIIFLGSLGHPILLITLYVYCHPGKVTLNSGD